MNKTKIDVLSLFQNAPIAWINTFIPCFTQANNALTKHQKSIANNLMLHRFINVTDEIAMGKTAIISLLSLWFLSTHKFSKVLITAPNTHQLQNVIMYEITKWANECVIKDSFKLSYGKLQINNHKDWFCAVRSCIKKEQCFGGFCANYILYIVDEAQHVLKEVFTPLNNELNNKNAYILTIATGATYDISKLTDPIII